MMTILLETALFSIILTLINLFTSCLGYTFIEVEHSAKFESRVDK